MVTLKPCPFCGGEAQLFKDNYEKCAAYCTKCGLYIGVELECGIKLKDGWRAKFKNKEEAIEAWNGRA